MVSQHNGCRRRAWHEEERPLPRHTFPPGQPQASRTALAIGHALVNSRVTGATHLDSGITEKPKEATKLARARAHHSGSREKAQAKLPRGKAKVTAAKEATKVVPTERNAPLRLPSPLTGYRRHQRRHPGSTRVNWGASSRAASPTLQITDLLPLQCLQCTTLASVGGASSHQTFSDPSSLPNPSTSPPSSTPASHRQ